METSFFKNLFTKKSSFQLTEEFNFALTALEKTNENLFITGKAGTGKSTLIQYFRDHTKKSLVILAPTGIAALNIGGQTIHSFFKFPHRIIDKNAIRQRSDTSLFAKIDTIIIDEVSMVRADVFDGIDLFLRKNGKDQNLPFGGVQIVLVGDLFQLPPVVPREEAEIIQKMYDSAYFYNSNVYKRANFKIIELTSIFRQKEDAFIDLLNKIRIGEIDQEQLEPINARVGSKETKDHIILTTTNSVADGINETRLNSIFSPLFTYDAILEGEFPNDLKSLPVPYQLKLKKGARVMFVKNDRGGRWINGTLGWIDELKKDMVKVRISDGAKSIVVDVPLEVWENIKYENDPETDEIKAVVVGKLKQFPLRLAWAITIHKSQGMTFSKVKIDFTKAPFAPGQTYVAISRSSSLNGLVLSKKIWVKDIIIDSEIIEYHRSLTRLESD